MNKNLTNPAEILRDIAEQSVKDNPNLSVDHESFEKGFEFTEELVNLLIAYGYGVVSIGVIPED